VVEVQNLALAGLRGTGVCFVRSSAAKLWQDLDCWLGSTSRVCYISGPPGMGKSTELLAFVMFAVPGDFIWIHERYPHNHRLFHRENGVTAIADYVSSDLVLFSYIAAHYPIIILDGITADNVAVELLWRTQEFERKFIMCSSNTLERFTWDLITKIGDARRYNLLPWSFEELEDVRAAGCFGDMTEETLSERYFYSGGCIRNVTTDVVSIRSALDYSLSCVSDPAVLFRGMTGSQSGGAVGAVIGATDNYLSGPISQYVARRLSERWIQESCIRQVFRAVRSNTEMLGWVFEMEFLSRVQRALIAETAFQLVGYGSIRPGLCIPYDPEIRTDFGALMRIHRVFGVFPKAYNQGGFSFALITAGCCGRCPSVELFLTTIGNKYDYNYQPVADLLHVIFPEAAGPLQTSGTATRGKVANVSMKVVLPSSRFTKFSFIGSVAENEVSVQAFDKDFVHQRQGASFLQVGRAEKVHFKSCHYI
jgi:hypothetical protein